MGKISSTRRWPYSATGLRLNSWGLTSVFKSSTSAHYAGFETAHAHAFDIGIVIADLGIERVEYLIDIHPFQVDHQTVRIFDGELVVANRLAGFDGDTGVILSRPYAHGADSNGSLCMGNPQQTDCRTDFYKLFKHLLPVSVCASRLMLRPSGRISKIISTSAGGSKPAACSGHSTRQILLPSNSSLKPALSHSPASRKRYKSKWRKFNPATAYCSSRV